VTSAGLKLILLGALLVQYSPLRICAFERVAVGSNCHDRDAHGDFGDSHKEEHPAGGEHQCVCELPKVDARHDSQGLRSPLDWAHLSLATAEWLLIRSTELPALADPDPHPGARAALQLPLLI
jgi:hypothetical protein